MPAFSTEFGLEGDIWGDPELPLNAEEHSDDGDDDDETMEAPSTEHPSTLPRPPHFDEDRNPFVTVIDVSGIHHLPVVQCSCEDVDVQIDVAFLKMGLFPTSFERIQTVFTLDVLKDFRLSNLECKTSAYQYYQRLRRLTCPAFPKAVLNRYQELRRLSREYRNIKLWKMHGRAHDEPDGPQRTTTAEVNTLTVGLPAEVQVIEALQEDIPRGKLASFCPTCPQLGLNLPNNWQEDDQK